MERAKVGAIVDSYRLLQELGEGWSANVFLATPMSDKPFAAKGELVALKLFKGEVLKDAAEPRRIKEEFEQGNTISHPNVVRVFEYGDCGQPGASAPYIVMEYVDGEKLSRWVRINHPISNSLLTSILLQLLDGLSEVHRLGFIHRDIKPTNVMLTERFYAKVMDLGIAIPKAEVNRDFTPDDQFLASIRYSAPELLRQAKDYDERVDLYSFGAVMYFLLHDGKELFGGVTNKTNLQELVLHETPTFKIADESENPLHRKLADLCGRLLAKKPEQRPKDAQEVMEEIRQHSESAPLGPTPLCGYMAAALTGLSDMEREAITFIGYTMAKALKDLNIHVHQPRKATDPILNRDISARQVYLYDRRRIVASDLAIVVCNEPSFGVGQEIEIIASYGTPTILVRRADVPISRMVTGSPANLLGDVEYHSPEELEDKLVDTVSAHLEALRERSKKFPRESGVCLGNKVRELREREGWDLDAAAAQYGLSPSLVAMIEDNPDHFHNAGIVALTRIAAAHGVPLSDIICKASVQTAALSPRTLQDDELQLILRTANEGDWTPRDIQEYVEDYESVVKERGRRGPLTKAEICRRHKELRENREGEFSLRP
jgi:serine/threonine-protein kinase